VLCRLSGSAGPRPRYRSAWEKVEEIDDGALKTKLHLQRGVFEGLLIRERG